MAAYLPTKHGSSTKFLATMSNEKLAVITVKGEQLYQVEVAIFLDEKVLFLVFR